MTRQEYLAELNTNLMSLPEEERENAVRFYDEYFEDAGPENEQSVIEELGKPFALAKSIICEQSEYSKSRSYAKYRESKELNGGAAAQDAPKGEPDVMPERKSSEKPHTQYTAYNYGAEKPGNASASSDNTNNTASGSSNNNYGGSYEEYKENYQSSASSENTYSSYSPSGNDDTAFVIRLILGIIFGIPLLLFTIFTVLGFAVGTLACTIGAIICLIVGAVALIGSFGTGMITIGAGIVCAGFTFLLLIPTVLGFGKLLPWLFKSIGKFFRKHSGGVM